MVDIATYRARIGCFSVASGVAIDLDTFRVVGAAGVIGMLLFIAGIELNPGPFKLVSDHPFVDLTRLKINRLVNFRCRVQV